jgi:hypothetical protein
MPVRSSDKRDIFRLAQIFIESPLWIHLHYMVDNPASSFPSCLSLHYFPNFAYECKRQAGNLQMNTSSCALFGLHFSL